MIDIVIPTMWMSKNFDKALEFYCDNPLIGKIIIIDNDRNHRIKSSIINHSKIHLISYGRNIYVNPAWNEGVKVASTRIVGIINDDIIVQDDVFQMVIDQDMQEGDLIGVNLRGYQNNYKIDDVINTEEKIVRLNYKDTEPIGGQSWAFGICMFITKKSYTPIPSLYQVWYGDDYLTQKSKRIFAINSNKIKGTISETLKKFNDLDSDVSRRIELDSKNFIKFGHFKDGDKWDIPHNIIKKYSLQRSETSKLNDDNVFQEEYEIAKKTPSDINQNLHILYDLAKECKTVIEMGVRTGVSTRAFLNTDVELTSYDIHLNQKVQNLFDKARKKGKNVKYIKDDVLKISIDEVDLLFIDTYHTYDQLKRELILHGNKAKKYLVFHDTHTFGLQDEVGKGKGLLPAIIEFMINNTHWKFKINKLNNNGLMVLER